MTFKLYLNIGNLSINKIYLATVAMKKMTSTFALRKKYITFQDRCYSYLNVHIRSFYDDTIIRNML